MVQATKTARLQAVVQVRYAVKYVRLKTPLDILSNSPTTLWPHDIMEAIPYQTLFCVNDPLGNLCTAIQPLMYIVPIEHKDVEVALTPSKQTRLRLEVKHDESIQSHRQRSAEKSAAMPKTRRNQWQSVSSSKNI